MQPKLTRIGDIRQVRLVEPDATRLYSIHIRCYRGYIGGEVPHHVPGLGALRAFSFANLPLQLGLLAGGVVCYIALTGLALKSAAASFGKTDL